jgi:small subunit ribosomal protein S19
MSRSLKKGPFVDPKLMKKVLATKSGSGTVIKTWSRASEIAPEFVGQVFGVHNGRTHVEVRVTEEMVGHRLGEFSPTRKFIRHGGKMQKELEAGKTAAAAPAKPAATKKK